MLPTFLIDIDDENLGIEAISLVQNPAVERNFLAFEKNEKKTKKFFFDEEKHLLKGVVCRADFPVYRCEGTEEYFVVFTKKVISKMIEKFFRENLLSKVNIEHSSNDFVNGVFVVESFQIDRENGIDPKEFKDVEDGSWICTYKVDNEEVWKKVKEKEFKGFSLEGLFNLNLLKENFNKNYDLNKIVKNLINDEN